MENPNIPVFYVLPKVHKSLQNPPGRPIVSGVGSITANLSGMIDFLLQPLMSDIPSFLKDTSHTIRVLKDHKWENKNFLVTADVSSLYSIIDHTAGIEAVSWALKKREFDKEKERFILEGIKFILENNFFWFNGDFFLQQTGTAMGTKFAPAYANIFMAWWEETWVYSHPLAKLFLSSYFRYIDDILFIWKGDEGSLAKFCDHLNGNKLNICLDFKISQNEINFLDLIITGDKNILKTHTYYKSTDANSFIPKESSHLPRWLNSVPYSQFIRIRRNCTDKTTFLKQGEDLKQQFIRKGYKGEDLELAFKKAEKRNRRDLLKIKKKKKGSNFNEEVAFVTQFCDDYKSIEKVLKKHWDLLKHDTDLEGIIKENPKFIYKKARNIKNEVVRSVTTHPTEYCAIKNNGFYRCGNCIVCRSVKMKDTKITEFEHPKTGKKYKIEEFITCDSKNCVYIMECECKSLYVGRSTRKLKERWGEHLRNIKKGDMTHPLSLHFKEKHKCSFKSIKSFIGFKKVRGNWRKNDHKEALARKEMEIIYKLDTLFPNGLNNAFELKWFL